MKHIQYYRYGGPETMQLEDFELQTPGKGEVAVKVAFAAINPIDWKVRNGYLKMVTGKSFPRAMGNDFSGTVISVGPGVTRFKPGDAVFGLARIKESGAFGHAVVTNETFLAKRPDNVSFEDAACLGTPGVTAWNGLVDKAKLDAGKCVFVNGCTGAVGEATVQIARMLGATVAGSCSAGAMERARSLGVETVFDYRTTDLSKLGKRFDVVYDTAATMTVETGLSLLGPVGVFLDINPTPGKFIRSIFNKRLKPIVCTPRADILDSLARAAKEEKLRLPVAETVPLSEAIQLVIALEGGRKLGGKGLIAMD
ncbi:NAD(P)-dependent alcohol dehydrogenase [Pectobacterium versatile]|uniref:NAD(P)-dependent alcohol dehydrogenase n=1 Tax=Pectobacterium versatile TaxID=2488639 RepID=UPI001B39B716|nr:NAD(P)-dependent alcohol dehydrogenase [Pectobacterium versatile]MBQ4780382.1 zinc-binding dehydrogenase [Pectobacterium versatile]MBQ4784777.1 zinc-binding dehydrogenase [Pectobacterium versatile]MBQ4793763.1 zinc-binding dehydrogenase [Pectobacterium versatile]